MISGEAVANVGLDVTAKFGDSRSNSFRYMRGADLVSNGRTNEHDQAYPNSAKRLIGV